MKNYLPLIWVTLFFWSCQEQKDSNVYTADIDHFWQAYDSINSTADTVLKKKHLQEYFLDKASPGQKAMIEVRNYSPEVYLNSIENLPKFWKSVRANTLTAKDRSKALVEGIKKLENIYSPLKPASIYFTMGALRSNGTTLDSLVLIGSELAMTDENTVTEEFENPFRDARRKFFDSRPIDNLTLLFVHEYVHTQQKPIVHNLLSQCLYEGVAEFVSVKAMGEPSSTPAVAFGKENEKALVTKFEKDMFLGTKTYEWLWGDVENGFGVRDLGYFIGYEICERYYEQAADKSQAIRDMVELDYQDEDAVEEFVDGTGFFTDSLEGLYARFEGSRPTVIEMEPFANGDQVVPAGTNTLVIHFSEAMDIRRRNFDYGPLGPDNAIQITKVKGFSEDAKSLILEIEALLPNKQYQMTVGSGFMDKNGAPLKSYLIDIKTGS